VEVREKDAQKENLERPLKWFVLPNESDKWDFVLEKYVDEQQEATQNGGAPHERLAVLQCSFGVVSTSATATC